MAAIYWREEGRGLMRRLKGERRRKRGDIGGKRARRDGIISVVVKPPCQGFI